VIDGLSGLGISATDLAQELHLFIERLMRRYVGRVGKSRWVDKTPNYSHHTALLERLFEKQILYVVLARHPLDCICSLETYLVQSPINPDPEIASNTAKYGRGRYAWARYWLEVYGKLDVFAASCPERCIRMRYEDLVRSPHETLTGLFEFIGESYDPEIVARAFASEHAWGYGDKKIRESRGIHAASIGRWEKWSPLETAALWNIVGAQATSLGYTLDKA
jgi:protein-tyrosine sulfotransferase